MRVDLESTDVEVIALRVIDALKPMLTGKDKQEDILFDVKSLGEYLGVTSKWIHERTHLKQMPYFKLSNKQLRFRKRDIDKWLESHKAPAMNDYRGKMRG